MLIFVKIDALSSPISLRGKFGTFMALKVEKKAFLGHFLAFFGLFSTFLAINDPNYPLKEIGDDSASILAKISKKKIHFFSIQYGARKRAYSFLF